ncbi:MAG: glycerol-3-phosphate responsive antiterminator [Erysipelotrichaceae bacterium]
MDSFAIPVIKDFKELEIFIKSELTWCILVDFHMNFLSDLLKQLHDVNKFGIVHLDLTHGLANDEFAVQYLCQKIHCDGIISTKPKALQMAKKLHVLSILRVFLIDSQSLNKGISLGESLAPDYIEVLPATTPHAMELIRKITNCDIIGGGLITSFEDMVQCHASGMKHVTTSSLALSLAALQLKSDYK